MQCAKMFLLLLMFCALLATEGSFCAPKPETIPGGTSRVKTDELWYPSFSNGSAVAIVFTQDRTVAGQDANTLQIEFMSISSSLHKALLFIIQITNDHIHLKDNYDFTEDVFHDRTYHNPKTKSMPRPFSIDSTSVIMLSLNKGVEREITVWTTVTDADSTRQPANITLYTNRHDKFYGGRRTIRLSFNSLLAQSEALTLNGVFFVPHVANSSVKSNVGNGARLGNCDDLMVQTELMTAKGDVCDVFKKCYPGARSVLSESRASRQRDLTLVAGRLGIGMPTTTTAQPETTRTTPVQPETTTEMHFMPNFTTPTGSSKYYDKCGKPKLSSFAKWGSHVLTVFICLIVGLAVGGGVTYLLLKNKMNKSRPQPEAPKNVDLPPGASPGASPADVTGAQPKTDENLEINSEKTQSEDTTEKVPQADEKPTSAKPKESSTNRESNGTTDNQKKSEYA